MPRIVLNWTSFAPCFLPCNGHLSPPEVCCPLPCLTSPQLILPWPPCLVAPVYPGSPSSKVLVSEWTNLQHRPYYISCEGNPKKHSGIWRVWIHCRDRCCALTWAYNDWTESHFGGKPLSSCWLPLLTLPVISSTWRVLQVSSTWHVAS